MSKKLSIGDIRVVIGSVLGIIGIYLLLVAFAGSNPDELAKSAGIHTNLWGGIVLVVVAIIMWVWAAASPDGGKSPDVVEEEHEHLKA